VPNLLNPKPSNTLPQEIEGEKRNSEDITIPALEGATTTKWIVEEAA